MSCFWMQVSRQEARLEEESSDEGEEGQRGEPEVLHYRDSKQSLVLATMWERGGPGGCNSVTNVQQALGTRYTSTRPICLKKKSGGSPDLSSLPSLVPSLPSWSQNSTPVSTGSLE